MKKRIVAIFLAAGMVLLLVSGCGKKRETGSEGQKPAAEETSEKEESGAAQTAKPAKEAGKEEEEREKGAAKETEETVYLEAYSRLLIKLLDTGKLPDGRELFSDGMGDFGELSENRFAVADVDQDGQLELIFIWNTDTMAGMFEAVYQYLPETDAYREELLTFPGAEYYTKGLILDGWSHNQGLGSMWPYTIYEYDSRLNCYEQAGWVDSWDRSYHEEDYSGNPFPAEKDKDGAGVLYSISYRETYPDVHDDFSYSQSEYEEFYDWLMKGREKIELAYLPLSRENAEALPDYYSAEKKTIFSNHAPKEMKDGTIENGIVEDGIYAAAFEDSDIYSYQDSVGIYAYLFAEESFAPEDVRALEEGDRIVINGEAHRIRKIEEKDGGYIVNDGEDDRFSLIFRGEDGVYLYQGPDGENYIDCGATALALTDDCIIRDWSNPENEEDGEAAIVPVDELKKYVKKHSIWFRKTNTRIRIEDGDVAEMTVEALK